MTNYDGPSYYKKDHPKAEKLNKAVKEGQSNYSLPKTVRTPQEMREEARDYMKTPSKQMPSDPPPERFPFKPTRTPSSLQKLDGWDRQHVDVEQYIEVHTRLQKKTETYLLFADHLSDEMKEKIEKKKEKASPTPIVEEGKVTLVREGLADNILKPGSGLHRSLSNIIADEQKTIHKNKDGLEKLFNQNQRKQKK